MEKLINLLNEYFDKDGIFKAIGHNDRQRVFDLENDDMVRDTAIISKEYGFIKWLVDYDKINIDKIENSEYYLIDWFYYNERKKFGIEWLDDVEKILLMLLAISDNPIEDLISYLK